MNIEDLNSILAVATVPHRKGDVVVEQGAVTEVFGYPHITEVPSGMRLVDVHFIVIAVDMQEARAAQPRLEEILADYPEPERLAGGPSYMELGAVLGSQESALRLIALGAALGMWDLITPGTLRIEGPEADAMAGNGFVMLSGWPPQPGSRLAERAASESGEAEPPAAVEEPPVEPVAPAEVPPAQVEPEIVVVPDPLVTVGPEGEPGAGAAEDGSSEEE